MSYRTIFHPEARAELRKIPQQTAMQILRKLDELETDPFAFGTTAMVSRPNQRRLRVGDYRVIYTVDQETVIIWVFEVGHRSSIYGN